MICGSIQPGVPREFLLRDYRNGEGARREDAARYGWRCAAARRGSKPTVITPNQHEAERLLGRALLTRSQFLEAVDSPAGDGPESVILSLGSRGAIGSGPDGVFEALPPRVDALCPIGAGDSLAAAFVWAMDKKKAFYEALRWGVAAGTASAALPGMSFPTIEQTRAIYKQVDVRPARLIICRSLFEEHVRRFHCRRDQHQKYRAQRRQSSPPSRPPCNRILSAAPASTSSSRPPQPRTRKSAASST